MNRSLATRITVAVFALTTAFAVLAQEKGATDAEKIKLLTVVCAACHGADGNSSVAPANPKLAGQLPDYLLKQLKDFKSADGKPAQRQSDIMAGMVVTLTDEDMKLLAGHFGAQKIELAKAKDRELVAAGQKLWRGGDAARGIPACAGCHGPSGSGIPAQFPRLSGQHPEYTTDQLNKFRSGARANDPQKMMRSIAVKLTDSDIKALSDYIAGLH